MGVLSYWWRVDGEGGIRTLLRRGMEKIIFNYV
jgi:hypothetical protein